jgi:hypothetical protein
VVISLCLIGFALLATFSAEEPSDPFMPDTVWKGEIKYAKTDYSPVSKPLPMILYIKQRKGTTFEGVTWYPARGNGMLMVTGSVGVKGAVTLSEEKVIRGQATAQRNSGVVAGMRFTGQWGNVAVKGSGEWTGPAFNGPIRVTFRLKRLENKPWLNQLLSSLLKW